MLWSRSPQPDESAAQWFTRRRRWETIRWPAAHAAGVVAALVVGWWMVTEHLDGEYTRGDPRMLLAGFVSLCIAGDQAVRFGKCVPSLVAIRRDPVIARIHTWGDFEGVTADIAAQLGVPVAIAGELIFTEDYVVDESLDVRRIEDIHAIQRIDTVYKSYGFIERATVRTTSLVFEDAEIPLATGPGIGAVLAHCQRRAPWLAASLGVDPAKLRAPAPAARKSKRPQGPVEKNPPTRRPPPRAS